VFILISVTAKIGGWERTSLYWTVSSCPDLSVYS
jgi:hypothetical protein